MDKLLIKSRIVSDDLASFQWNFDLNTENKKFNTVEEANDLPLAKEMFYLPFIKSVSISKNEMLLERFDIVSWEDVLDEVEKIIEKKLQSIFSDKFQMVELIEEGYHLAREISQSDRWEAPELFEQQIRELIGSFDQIGLCNPNARSMYRYTAIL